MSSKVCFNSTVKHFQHAAARVGSSFKKGALSTAKGTKKVALFVNDEVIKKATAFTPVLANAIQTSTEWLDKGTKAVNKPAKLIEKIAPGHMTKLAETFKVLEGVGTVVELINPFLTIPKLYQTLRDKKATDLRKHHTINVFAVQIIAFFGALSKVNLLKTAEVSVFFSKARVIGPGLGEIKFMQILSPALMALAFLGMTEQTTKIIDFAPRFSKAKRKERFWKNATDFTTQVKYKNQMISLADKIRAGNRYKTSSAAYRAKVDAVLDANNSAVFTRIKAAKARKHNIRKWNVGKDIGKSAYAIAADGTKGAWATTMLAITFVAPKSNLGVALTWIGLTTAAQAAVLALGKLGLGLYIEKAKKQEFRVDISVV